MNNAIDLSFSALDVGAIPPGVDLVIQNLWTGSTQPEHRVENLRAAVNAGKRIAGYFAINPSLPDNATLARDGVPDDLWALLEFVAPDCELYTTLTPAKVRAESDRMYAKMIAPRCRPLYTVIGYWNSGMIAGDATFGDHLLWDARPDGRPFASYGAWRSESQVIGVQTSSSTPMGASTVDYDEWKEGVPMPPDPAMNAAAVAEARRQLIGAVLINDMSRIVADLVLFGVLPPGTTALKPAL